MIAAIHHVALIVDNLERARAFYTDALGLEELPAFNFDYPTQFYRINATQQLHLTEWPGDPPSFRGHLCVVVDDFARAYDTCKRLGVIDLAPWGNNPRRMPDGALQMFVRDPSGNLIEISYRGDVDPAVLAEAVVEEGIYISGRGDPRGDRSDDATLYHDR